MATRNRMTFAGRPFRMVSERVREHIDRYYPLRHLTDAQPLSGVHQHKNLLPLSLPQSLPVCPRLNDLWYPTGATRFAFFRGLMVGDDKDAVEALAYASSASTAQAFVLSANDVTVETNLYMLPPRPVAPLQSGRNLDSLWLVTLVDERFYWQGRSAGVVNCTDGGTGTWTALLNTLATALGITLTYTAVASVYGEPEPDSALYSSYESPAALLDAVAHSLGGVIVRKLNGTYELVRWSEANTLAASLKLATGAQAGGELLSTDTSASESARAAVLPRRVVVTFPRFVSGSGYEIPSPNYRAWELTSYPKVYAVTVNASSLGAPYNAFPTIDLERVVRTTAKALFTNPGDATPTNNTSVTDLANQLAKDVLDRHAGSADVTYPAVYAADPKTGCDILWAWAGAGKPYTRLCRPAFNLYSQEMQHGFGEQDAAGSSSDSILCEVTVSATAHTVKRKTFNTGTGAIVDYSPATMYTNCRATTAANLPVGTLVTLDPIPDVNGNYWITPVQYATQTLPGLVSAAAQTFGGAKTFHNGVIVTQSGVLVNGGGVSTAHSDTGPGGGGIGAGLWVALAQPNVIPRWTAPTVEGTHAVPTAATPPDGSDEGYVHIQSGPVGVESVYLMATPTPGAGFGYDLWVLPTRTGSEPTFYAGRFIVVGRYAYWNPADGKVYTGATATGGIGPGAKVAGGLIYDAGSGSFYFPGGTDVAVADGGTGASDAATARSNLGAAAASHTHGSADITDGQSVTINYVKSGGAGDGTLTFTNGILTGNT